MIKIISNISEINGSNPGDCELLDWPRIIIKTIPDEQQVSGDRDCAKSYQQKDNTVPRINSGVQFSGIPKVVVP